MTFSDLISHGGRGHGKSYLLPQYQKLIWGAEKYFRQGTSPYLNISPYSIRLYFTDLNKVVLKRSKKSMATRFYTLRFEEGVYRVQWDRQEDSNIPGVMMGDLNVPMEFLMERLDQVPPESGYLTKSYGRQSFILPSPPKYDRKSKLLRLLRNRYGLAYSWDRRHSVPVPEYIHEQIVDMFLEQIKPLGL